MNLDLLSQNLLIVICIIYTALTFYIISHLLQYVPSKLLNKKQKKKYLKNNLKELIGVIVFSIILAFVVSALIDHYTDGPLPSGFMLMCLPFTLLLGLSLWSLIFKKTTRILCGVTIVVGLLFSLVIINNYYRYYPVLGEVFGKTNTTYLKNNLNNITVNYTVSTKQATYNSASLQGALNSLNKSVSTDGKIYSITIPSTVSKFKARTGFVYIPAAYNNLVDINFPVIVLTAGVPGTPLNWLGLGLQNIMDQFAKSHQGITPLVFVADSTGSITNDTECVNSPRGNVETYLTVDVPNYIKKNFRVDTSPSNWAIGGLSLGGMCSIMLTLLHPNIYNYFIDLGGEVGPEDGSKQETIDTLFNGSEAAWEAHQPLLLLQKNKYTNIGGFFGVGAQDNLNVTQAISQLSQATKKAGISTVTEVINGQHTFNVWAETYKLALPWISNRIGATVCYSSCL